MGSSAGSIVYDGSGVYINGRLQGGTAAISGTTMTGSGFQFLPGGSFAIGNSTSNITFNGSSLFIRGFINQLTERALTAGSGYFGPSGISTFTDTVFTSVVSPCTSGKLLFDVSGTLEVTANTASDTYVKVTERVYFRLSSGGYDSRTLTKVSTHTIHPSTSFILSLGVSLSTFVRDITFIGDTPFLAYEYSVQQINASGAAVAGMTRIVPSARMTVTEYNI
jgi:hypothetical protein